MKRSIISQYEQLKGRLSAYCAMLYYRYLNLCIKAEEASLLSVAVLIEDEPKSLEDTANIAKDGEYAFKVFPKYDEDLLPIAQGIAMAHPEFKQEHKEMDLEMDDGQKIKVKYIQVTMPEVDKNRYDLLKQATNAFYEECKAKMEVVKSETEGKIAIEAVDEKPEMMDQVRKAIKELDETWTGKREQLHDDKLKEIEEAYAKYQQARIAAEQKRREEEMARGNRGQSLDMKQLQEEQE